jgi:hypothetical protein
VKQKTRILINRLKKNLAMTSETPGDNDILNLNNLNLGCLSFDQWPKISIAEAGASIKYLYIRGNMLIDLWDTRLTANLQVR